MSTGDFETSFCLSSGWQKTTPNPYLTIRTITTVLIITKMECRQWYHSCHQSKSLAAAYPASSPPNDCSSAARRRAVPRPTSPSLYPKVVRLIRPSILLQRPSQRRTISQPRQWEALNLLHHRRKQTYPHRPHQSHTPINPPSTNAPTVISSHRVAARETSMLTLKTHNYTLPQSLHLPPIETAIAATLHLLQAASGTVVHPLTNTSRPNKSENSNISNRSSNSSKCKTNHQLPTATMSRFSKSSASAWKILVRRSFRQLSKNTTSTPTGRIMRCTSCMAIKSGVWGYERSR